MSQKIIAIDDSDIAQDFIRATLADIGFENVTGFQDPLKALDAIKLGGKPADLILLDIMMPEMDGIELCARIRAIDAWNDVPIIMLTSRKDVNSLTQAFMAGANDYVTKPFDRIELQARMRSCLRLKSELDRRRASERRQALAANADVFSEPPVGIGDVIGTKAGFNASLLSLGVAAQKQIGLVALKVDDIPAWVAAPPADRREVLRRVAEVLGNVAIPARDMFAHWEDDLFCLASFSATPAELEKRARALVDAVRKAGLTIAEDWVERPISISAGIAMPNGNAVASNLAAAVRAAENAARSGRGAEVLTLKSESGPFEH